jgi:hypothetical protein
MIFSAAALIFTSRLRVSTMDEFSDDDVYSVQCFSDPKGDWIRVFRNGAMAIDCLPIDELLANPKVRGALEELVKAQGVPFWYTRCRTTTTTDIMRSFRG